MITHELTAGELGEIAAVFEDEVRMNGNEVVEIEPRYSGRGMYGATCVGIVTDGNRLGDVYSFLSAVCRVVDRLDEDDVPDLANRTHTDNMGRRVIFYWPELVTTGAEEEDEDEEN